MLRGGLTALLVMLLTCGSLVPGSITLAAEQKDVPHENPSSADVRYDGVAILEYHTRLLDGVLAREVDTVSLLRGKEPFANLDEDLRSSVSEFGDAAVALAGGIVEIAENLERLEMLALQYRVTEWESLHQETGETLTAAYEELLTIERTAGKAGALVGVHGAGAKGRLLGAYDDVQDRIERLRSLLDLWDEQLDARLLEPPIRTLITLRVEPDEAYVGEAVEVRGELTGGGEGMGGRKVTVLLDGVPHMETITASDGSFQTRLQLPFEYVPAVTLEALYYPRGEDIGVYVASKSEPVEVALLFYAAELEIEAPKKAYPGLEMAIEGRFDYGENPVPPQREIGFYIDGEPVGQDTVGGMFEKMLALDGKLRLGEHRLTVDVPARERYAPVEAEALFEVVRVTPVIEMSPPALAVMPFAVTVKGKVDSEIGPLGGLPIEASFNGHEARGVTSEDGSFSVRVDTGFDFSLIGSQEVGVLLEPEDSWISVRQASRDVVTINPVLIVVLAGGVVFVLVASGRRLKAWLAVRATRSREAVPAGVVPVPVAEGTARAVHDLGATPRATEGRELMIELYRRLLKLVQQWTGAQMRADMTYREFARASGGALGPARTYWERLTRLVERVLYSRYGPLPDDVAESRELSQRVEDSLRYERS